MTKKIEIAPGVWAVLLAEEAADTCEKCGKVDETRPYGPKLESGRRMRLCFACAMLDKAQTNKAISEFFDGEDAP